MFFGNSRIYIYTVFRFIYIYIYIKISWLNCEQYGKNQYKEKEDN